MLHCLENEHASLVSDHDSGDLESQQGVRNELAERLLTVDDAAIDSLKSNVAKGRPITLQEQLELAFTTTKKQEASRKMLRKMKAEADYAKIRENIITFKYAADYSLLRRSSPDDVWVALLRREAWRQIPAAMLLVTVVQAVAPLLIVMSSNTGVDVTTLVISAAYVLAVSVSNPLVITGELSAIVNRIAAAYTQTFVGTLQFYIVCTLLSPILVTAFVCAYTVTLLLDLTTGPILDVSYESMVNIVVHIIVVLCGLSVGLRSANLLSAFEVFAAFTFIYHLDRLAMSHVKVDMMAPTKRNNNIVLQVLAVRLIVYILTALLFGWVLYLTISNDCYIYCYSWKNL